MKEIFEFPKRTPLIRVLKNVNDVMIYVNICKTGQISFDRIKRAKLYDNLESYVFNVSYKFLLLYVGKTNIPTTYFPILLVNIDLYRIILNSNTIFLHGLKFDQ